MSKVTPVSKVTPIYGTKCFESQKGGGECFWHPREQIPLHIFTHYPCHHPNELCKDHEDLPWIWKKGGTLYYKDYFLVVMLALVTPTITSSGQTWVRTDPRLIVGSSTGCLWASPQFNKTQALPPPAPLARDDRGISYFIIGDNAFPWRCTSLAQHNLAHKRIFNYQCFESQKGGWECLQQSCEQIQLPTQCPGPISNSAKIMKTCLVLYDMMLCVGPAEYVTTKRGCCRSLQYSWFPKPYKSAKGREICMGPDGYVTRAQCTVL